MRDCIKGSQLRITALHSSCKLEEPFLKIFIILGYIIITFKISLEILD